ncbi:MAG: hypothetical protein RSC08_04390 [Oscillospiraceae bacterium]
MKRQFSILALSLVMVLSLAGCMQGAPEVTPTPTHTATPSTLPSPEYSASPDGQVVPTEPESQRRSAGRSEHSALEKVGKGIDDSIHSIENNFG